MITPYESERLIQLIRNKNRRHRLDCANARLSFDASEEQIVTVGESYAYTGRQTEINILPRLIEKYSRGLSFEVHLQAYITGNIGLGRNPSLDASIAGDSGIEWIGNEVSCGVGMQRIDLMLSTIQGKSRTLTPIELKSVEADESNVRQIQRYINWIRQYYIPNQPSDIQPILLTKKIADKETASYQNLTACFNRFNEANHGDCHPLRFVEFFVNKGDLVFAVTGY